MIAPPQVTDAAGQSVPSSLRVVGETVTLTVGSAEHAVFPLLGVLSVAAPTNAQSIERDPTRWGLSDPHPELSGHVDAHLGEDGVAKSGFDPQLASGPAHTVRHMRSVRLIVPYDVVAKPSGFNASYIDKARHALKAFLNKARDANLEPYITIGRDEKVDPCKHNEGKTQQEREAQHCPRQSVRRYAVDVRHLTEDVIQGHRRHGWPLVQLWGAWKRAGRY